MTAIKFIERLVVHYPKTILIVTILLGSAAFPSLYFLANDPSPHLLPPSHPARHSLKQLREDYTGANPGVFIMLEAKDTIFKAATLERIQKLTEAIENLQLLAPQDLDALRTIAEQMSGEAGEQLKMILPKDIKILDEMFWMEFDEIRETLENAGIWLPEWDETLRNLEVRANPVVEVISLSNTDNILGSEDGLAIEPIFEEVPQTSAGMNRLRRHVFDNELFRNYLFSDDGRRTGIFMELAMDEEDTENLYATYLELERIFEDNPGDEAHFIAGFPIVAATLRTVIDQDTKRFFPFVALLAIFFLWLTFRRPSGVAVPMIVVGFSILFTLALMVIIDVPLNTITSALPVFLISIGVADGIHMFSEYRDNRLEGHTRETAVCLMLDKMVMPVTMTSITTAAGFFSLTASDIVPVNTFGIFVAIGTLLAMLLSLIFIPALLMVLPEKKAETQENTATEESKLKAVHKANFMDLLIKKFLDGITSWVVKNSKIILLGAFVVSMVSVYGLLQVEVESSLESYFQPDAPFVMANHAMQKMTGSRTINIVITKYDENEPWKNPENLKIVEELQHFLSQEDRVKRTFSLVDLIKRISYAFNENRDEYNRLPEAIELVKSEEVVTENGQSQLQAVEREVSGRELVAQYLVLYENSGGSFKLTSTGMVPINVATSVEVVSSQIRSLSGSILAVFVMLILIFRSIYRGMIGMAPLIFTVLFNFGVMGYFGVYLDIGTALVSSIVIGIGVDYSIHYLSRMLRELSLGIDLQQAISKTVRRSGKAITSNAVTVGFGFLALSVSEFLPLVTLSWMICLTLIISALATLILVPALVVTFPNVINIKDEHSKQI